MLRMRRLAVVAVVLLAAANCTRTAAPVTATLAIHVSDLGADRYRMTAPAEVAAGVVKVTFTNSGKIPHDAQLFRIDGNHTQDEVADTIRIDPAPTPEWLHAEGGVGTLTGGHSASVTVHLAVGTYFVMDTGVDEDSIPFAKAGAALPLAVVGTSDGLPAGGAAITEREYAFDIPNLRAGSATVRVDNAGSQVHQFLAAPLVPGRTIDDVRREFTSTGEPQGPSALDLNKAVSVARLDPGRSLVTTLTLKRGTYVFVCLLSDRAGGPRHVNLGMIAQVSVQ